MSVVEFDQGTTFDDELYGFDGGDRGEYIPEPGGEAAPIPPGRGRWRFLLCQRAGANAQTIIPLEEISDARTRRLERVLNAADTLTFTTSGDSITSEVAHELQHEVVAFRWNTATGEDQIMFRGVITQAQDTLTETVHTISWTCVDYLAMMGRRYFRQPYDTQTEPGATTLGISQDQVALDIINRAFDPGTPFSALGVHDLPLEVRFVYQDGMVRLKGVGFPPVPPRVRSYDRGKDVLEALQQLGNVINGFDFSQSYAYRETPHGIRTCLCIWYPSRGIERTSWAFVYGSTVSALTRNVNSSQFANYWLSIGSSPGQDETTNEALPPIWSEDWLKDSSGHPEALDMIDHPEGLWMGQDSLSDVTIQQTLDDNVRQQLASYGQLIPSYTLTMRPTSYLDDAAQGRTGIFPVGPFDLGDTVQLYARSGRLDVREWVRVHKVSFIINDDGTEDLEVEVGRPTQMFIDLLAKSDSRLSALERR